MRNGVLLLFGEFFLLCVLIFQILGVAGFEKPCNTSTSTVEFIKQCPTDQQKYIEAASRKNCAAIANTCESFEYHCVLNLWRNATLEVCAPSLIIVGRVCAEYSEGAMSVRVTEESCQNFSKPCPPRYNSTDGYKYPGCYDVAKKVSPPNTTPVDTTLSTVHITTTSSMSTVHNTTTSSTTPALTQSPSSEINSTMTPEKEGLSVEGIVGIALAVIFILILIMAAIVFMFVRHKMTTQRKTCREVFADAPFCCGRLAEGCTCIQTYMDRKYGPFTLQDVNYSNQSTRTNQNSKVPGEGISDDSQLLDSNNVTNTVEGITPDDSSSAPLLSNSNGDNAQDKGDHRMLLDKKPNVENQDDCDASVCDDEKPSSQLSRNQNESRDPNPTPTENDPSHIQQTNPTHTENDSSGTQQTIPTHTENDSSHIQQTNPTHTENDSSGTQQTNPTHTENDSSGTQQTILQPESPDGSSTLVTAGTSFRLGNRITLDRGNDTPVKSVQKDVENGAFSNRMHQNNTNNQGVIEIDNSEDCLDVNQLTERSSSIIPSYSDSGAPSEDSSRISALEDRWEDKWEKMCKEVDTLKTSQSQLQCTVGDLQAELCRAEREYHTVNEQLRQIRERLEQLHKENKDLKDESEEKDRKIKEQQQMLLEKDRIINDKDRIINDKDRIINDLERQRLEERKRNIEREEEAKKEMERQLARELEEKDFEIKQLKKKIKEGVRTSDESD